MIQARGSEDGRARSSWVSVPRGLAVAFATGVTDYAPTAASFVASLDANCS